MISMIERPFGCQHIAAMVPGMGYIPFAPYAGRHIMDDFGNLVQSLPQDQFDYRAKDLHWRLFWGYDIQYMYH